MSTPTPDPVGTVVPDASPTAAAANATEKVNEHTPDPETPPVVDEVPDPPRPDKGGIDALTEMVTKLAGEVAILTDAVLGRGEDASPAHVPWTHRGGKS